MAQPVMQAKAKAAADEAKGATGVGFDPSVIIGIVTTVLQLLAGCGKTPAQAAAAMKKPNQLQKLVFRAECRRHTHNRDDAEVLYAACLDQAASVTEEEAKAMYAEAGIK